MFDHDSACGGGSDSVVVSRYTSTLSKLKNMCGTGTVVRTALLTHHSQPSTPAQSIDPIPAFNGVSICPQPNLKFGRIFLLGFGCKQDTTAVATAAVLMVAIAKVIDGLRIGASEQLPA
eukprot:COSAG01_NODE_2498_length_7565_cov_341.465711_6_plen_119_part_00